MLIVGIYIRKRVRFLSKQGQHQPHFYSKARQLTTQLQNGIFEYSNGLNTCQTFCLTSMESDLPGDGSPEKDC